jgi:DNA uptake protein ComE-like DNA-binding protein
MRTAHSPGANAPFDGLIRLLVRTLSLGAIIGVVVAAFYVVPSSKPSSVPAPAASSTQHNDGSGAAQEASAQAQASRPRVVYSGQSIASAGAPKSPVEGSEATSSITPTSDIHRALTPSGAPISAASPAPRGPALTLGSNSTSLSSSGVVQVASVSERVEAPARQTGSGVNLNTATLEELNRLGGAGLIGKAIIRGRPYATPEDLLKKKVLSRAVYNRIKDQVATR